MKEKAETHIIEKVPLKKQEYISVDTFELIKQQEGLKAEENWNRLKELQKEIKKRVKPKRPPTWNPE